MLVSIGAVEFLSHLRRDIEPSLYQYIDDVLMNLLSLPDVLDSDDEHLHYDKGKQQTAEFDPDGKSTGIMHVKRTSEASEEIQQAEEECSISTQNAVDGIESTPAGQKWPMVEGRLWLDPICFNIRKYRNNQINIYSKAKLEI